MDDRPTGVWIPIRDNLPEGVRPIVVLHRYREDLPDWDDRVELMSGYELDQSKEWYETNIVQFMYLPTPG